MKTSVVSHDGSSPNVTWQNNTPQISMINLNWKGFTFQCLHIAASPGIGNTHTRQLHHHPAFWCNKLLKLINHFLNEQCVPAGNESHKFEALNKCIRAYAKVSMQDFWIVFKLHLSTGVPVIKYLCLPVHMDVCLGNCVCSHIGVHIFVCGCEGFHPSWDFEGIVPFIRIKN